MDDYLIHFQLLYPSLKIQTLRVDIALQTHKIIKYHTNWSYKDYWYWWDDQNTKKVDKILHDQHITGLRHKNIDFSLNKLFKSRPSYRHIPIITLNDNIAIITTLITTTEIYIQCIAINFSNRTVSRNYFKKSCNWSIIKNQMPSLCINILNELEYCDNSLKIHLLLKKSSNMLWYQHKDRIAR